MGADVGDADGDHVILLKCGQCYNYYETDETVGNDCPTCGWIDFQVVQTQTADPELSWRDDHETLDEVAP